MSHATAGELHALMDGALRAMEPARASEIERHLERCADCRALLEVEREVRDRAGEILASVGPVAGPRPAFEEVEARAASTPEDGRAPTSGAGGRHHDGAGSRTQRLAWAASLVVALGAGWVANAVLGGERPEVAGSFNDATPPVAVDARRADADGTRERRSTPGDDRPGVVSEGSNPATLARRRDEAAGSVGEDISEPGRTVADAPVSGEEAAAEAERVGDRAIAMEPSITRQNVPAARMRTTGADNEETIMPPDISGLLRLAETASWAATDSTAARHWMGRAPHRLPGAPAPQLEVASLAGQPVLRSTYVLESGESVVLLEAAAPVDPTIHEKVQPEPSAATYGNLEGPPGVFRRDGSTRVAWVRRGDVRLILTGSVAVDSLIRVVSNQD